MSYKAVLVPFGAAVRNVFPSALPETRVSASRSASIHCRAGRWMRELVARWGAVGCRRSVLGLGEDWRGLVVGGALG